MSNKLLTITLEGDKVHKIRNLLKIYAIVVFNEEITTRESEVLAEYLMYGCTEKADESIRLNYNINNNNIRQLRSRLQKKGLLVQKAYRQGTEMHPALTEIRTDFVENLDKYLLLRVWK